MDERIAAWARTWRYMDAMGDFPGEFIYRGTLLDRICILA